MANTENQVYRLETFQAEQFALESRTKQAPAYKPALSLVKLLRRVLRQMSDRVAWVVVAFAETCPTKVVA